MKNKFASFINLVNRKIECGFANALSFRTFSSSDTQSLVNWRKQIFFRDCRNLRYLGQALGKGEKNLQKTAMARVLAMMPTMATTMVACPPRYRVI